MHASRLFSPLRASCFCFAMVDGYTCMGCERQAHKDILFAKVNLSFLDFTQYIKIQINTCCAKKDLTHYIKVPAVTHCTDRVNTYTCSISFMSRIIVTFPVLCVMVFH